MVFKWKGERKKKKGIPTEEISASEEGGALE